MFDENTIRYMMGMIHNMSKGSLPKKGEYLLRVDYGDTYGYITVKGTLDDAKKQAVHTLRNDTKLKDPIMECTFPIYTLGLGNMEVQIIPK